MEIKEIRNYEELYHECHAQWSELIKVLPVGLLELSMEGVILHCNLHAQNLIGTGNQERLVGTRYLDSLSDEDVAQVERSFRRVAGQGQVEDLTVRGQNNHFFQLRLAPKMTLQRKISAVYVMMRDNLELSTAPDPRMFGDKNGIKRHLNQLNEEIDKLSEQVKLEQLDNKTLQSALKRKNLAIQEMLEQIKVEKRTLRDDMMANVNHVIMPSIKKLQNQQEPYLNKQLYALEKHFKELMSPYGNQLDKINDKLTPREHELCHMIKNGLTVKEIAQLSHTSPRTVETHRNNIRKKLGLSNKKINLAIYLRTL